MSGCYYINTSCWISAHNVETGEELWRRYTIPRQGEPGSESWGALPDEQRRGGSPWIAPSYDPKLNLIYVGVAGPIPWGAAAQRDTGAGAVFYTNPTPGVIRSSPWRESSEHSHVLHWCPPTFGFSNHQ